eukprot:CAMPEP_0184690420 /NCGR_PEP_ID=MMETSP0312-20130426/31217_1 /TAXON_ID=31354 /ORGANISM="Compsopogon coeruleus, Strain SAG 36.94" /LENGTH=81 /DNA_ID=CAMNT_0027147913 /DNA_START=1717 /DNA_END=1962 /DNA_ORIENTATION=-
MVGLSLQSGNKRGDEEKALSVKFWSKRVEGPGGHRKDWAGRHDRVPTLKAVRDCLVLSHCRGVASVSRLPARSPFSLLWFP